MFFSRIFSLEVFLLLLFFIALPVRSAVVDDGVRTKKLRYIGLGGIYFNAENFFSKGWAFDKGDLVINAQNARIKNKTGTIVVFANSINLRIPISFLFRLKFVPKIEKMVGVKVFIDASKNPAPGAGAKKDPFGIIADSISFLQEIILLTAIEGKDSMANKNIIQDAELNFVFGSDALNIKIESAVLQSRVLYNAETVARGLTFKDVISANILVNGDRSFANVSCTKGINARVGCMILSDAKLGRYLNQFVHTRKREAFFDFSGLSGNIKAFFGSYFQGVVHFFIDGHDKSVVKLFDGTKLSLKPIKSKIVLDVKKKELVLFPFNLGIENFTHGSFGMILSFGKSVKKFFTFSAYDIRNKNAFLILKTIRQASDSMNDVIGSIFDNVVFMGGIFNLKNSIIESSGNGGIFTDVNVVFDDATFQIAPLNDLMVRDLNGSINISSEVSKVTVDGGKIGNDFFDNALVTFYYNQESFPRVDVSFDANALQVGNIFSNKSMPVVFKKIVKWLQIRYGAIISGKIASSLILSKKTPLVDSFKIKGDIKFSELHNPFAITYSKSIMLSFDKHYKSPDLRFNVDFGDSELMYADKDALIKKPEEAMYANGVLKNFFIPNDRFDVSELIVSKQIKGISTVVLDGSFSSFLKDAKILSFGAEVKRFLLFDSNFTSTFELDKEDFYNLKIQGDVLDWRKFYKIFSYRQHYDENPILRTKLRAHVDLDRLVMFNKIEMKNVSANVDMSHGVFHKLAISSDVVRVDDAGIPILDWGRKESERRGDQITLESPLLLVVEKTTKNNHIHGYFENTRMLFDAFNLGGFYNRLYGGRLSVSGHQNSTGIVTDVVFKDFFYYPDNSFDGDFSKFDKGKGMDIDSLFCAFDYNIKKRVLQVKKGRLQSSGISSTAIGFVDFISRQLYFSGKLDIFTKKTGGFAVENVPVVGSAVSMSIKKRRTLFSFNYIVDGSLDNIKNAVKIRPSRSMFVLISFGGALLAFGLGLLFALI